jgi:type IV secretion system protein VirB8
MKDGPNKMPQGNDQGQDKNNWYADRYESVAVQRNMLFFISVIALVVTVISVICISKISLSKKVVPLVVEVEDKTGFTNFVNPEENQDWTTDKAINTYFLVKYIRARETYNVASYLYDYNTVVRLMSSPSVYRDFKEVLDDVSSNPVLTYGANNSTELKIRSIQFLKISPSQNNAQIRFAVVEQQGDKKTYNKIVSIVWSYVAMNLDFDDRNVNPLGFQILSYAISNDLGA